MKSFLTHDGGHGLIDIKGGGSIVEHREAFERKVDELLALAAKGGGLQNICDDDSESECSME